MFLLPLKYTMPYILDILFRITVLTWSLLLLQYCFVFLLKFSFSGYTLHLYFLYFCLVSVNLYPDFLLKNLIFYASVTRFITVTKMLKFHTYGEFLLPRLHDRTEVFFNLDGTDNISFQTNYYYSCHFSCRLQLPISVLIEPPYKA